MRLHPEIRQRSRDLRKNATPEENHLWYDALSNYPVRWHRQKPIGPYIVDFYCHQARLAVELDGSQHSTEEGKVNDRQRTEYLNQQGIEVLRFQNCTVNNDFFWVITSIRGRVITRLKEAGMEHPERLFEVK